MYKTDFRRLEELFFTKHRSKYDFIRWSHFSPRTVYAQFHRKQLTYATICALIEFLGIKSEDVGRIFFAPVDK